VLDQSGLDTELARLLHRTERVDLATLRGSLEEVRRARPEDGPTLARTLVGRGVLTEAELAELLGQLGPMSSRLTASFEESTFGAPAAERTEVSRPRPSARLDRAPGPASTSAGDLGRPRQGSTEGTERGFPWSPASGSSERVPPAAGGRPSGSWDVRPSARVADSAERVLDGWRIGGRIGDYVLESQAGAGAMGVVFIGRHVATGARSAVKTVRTSADAELVERFRREGEAQAKVDGHANVARVHSMGEAFGRLFLVMELVEGGNLDQRIKLGLPSFGEAACIVAGIAHGLAHMHARDVLHRDLKPANVLFDLEGTPKLVDFGLARLAGSTRLTVTGEVIGTPAFMAPEQTSGLHDNVGPWTDIWALGGVLLYVLTGRAPFEGQTTIEVLTRVAEEEAPSPRSRRPEVPQELDALCRKLMCRDTARRPSAAEAARALDAIAAREAAPPAVEPPRSDRVVKALAGVAALSVVAGALALALASPAREDDAPLAAPARATAAPSPTPGAVPPRRPPAPKPVEVEAPPAAAAQPPWEVGQRRRCVLTVQVEGELVQWMQRILVEILQRFDMTWRVTAVEADRVVIEATIEQFAITSVGRPPEGGAGGMTWDVAYDSQRDGAAASPFQAVVGSTLKLILDASTGQVLEELGGEVTQRIVLERATAAPPGAATGGDGRGDRWGRMRAVMQYQIPLLAEPDVLRETLNGALHVFPPGGRPDGRRWTLRREPQLTGSIWPQGCWAEVDLTASADQTIISWAGQRAATYKPAWAPANAQGELERIIEGRATLAPDGRRVASASFRESWKTAFAGQASSATRAVYDYKLELTDLP
jgi:tRNA A-37 threonylcarbamoyl transferase component Bud32